MVEEEEEVVGAEVAVEKVRPDSPRLHRLPRTHKRRRQSRLRPATETDSNATLSPPHVSP